MIKLFKITDLKYTLFNQNQSLKYLSNNAIKFTPNIDDADILVIHKITQSLFRQAKELFARGISKPILVWTHEPRYSPTDRPRLNDVFGCPVFNMNLYTRDVYFNNFTIYGHLVDQLLSPMQDVCFSSHPVVGLATYVFPAEEKFLLNGIDIDLSVKRQKLLTDGHDDGTTDIYGKNWPDGLSISESRGTGWRMAKKEILSAYQFNICLENTSFPYYCTEKIWDSIKWGCLPIYSSVNNAIYDIFPRNSFLDISEFGTNSELYEHIRKMGKRQYLQRMNACINTFNNIYRRIDHQEEKNVALAAIVKKLQYIQNL